MSGPASSRLPPSSPDTTTCKATSDALKTTRHPSYSNSPPPREMRTIKERVCLGFGPPLTEGLLIKSPPIDRPPCAFVPYKAAPTSKPT
eukprot:11310302-Prorocentrum_lima.AAC.1